MTESVCQTCGTPIPVDATTCPACGRDARTVEHAPDQAETFWEDDEALAVRVEQATAGEFEVEGLIGRGGMATVYLARERALERPVAIKVMSPHVMRSFGMAERFKREARVAAALSHPNIIPIYAVRESGPLICLVMKRLTGRSLDAILREHHPLPLPIAQLVIRDIAAGLEHAHQNGVIHRDVKPANILVDGSGAVVVTDFGIAKAREVDALTASGSTIGTPAYMSPEQAMGRRATPASDQYSLGAVAYELLAGRMPFVAETAMGLMYQHTHTPPEPLADLRPDLPREVCEAIQRMLAKSPEDRFPSLTHAVRSIGIPASAGALDDPVREALARLASGGPEPMRRISTPSDRTSGALRSGPRPNSDPNATTLPWLDTGQHRWRRDLAGVVTVALLVTLVAAGARLWTHPLILGAPPDTVSPRGAIPPAAARPPRTDPPAEANAPPTISDAIERYRRAVESRNLTQLLAAYPAMEPKQVETYRDFFRTSDQVRFEVIIKDLEQKDAEANMKLEGFIRFRDRKTGAGKITTYGTRARLVDGPTGWRIMEIR
jgi:serine/threonine protein kinase